eukprot:TRINITY_DN6778_c0_g1_i1.p1 TRINITY_DN6778_c0_g1~~TRINITY_DN6778_c0_g1_i1.p1  ORF type:complete len:675 (+),score=60.83 TRINITY_DN6778_c0_g1_i1:89-2113(+)
MASPKQALIFCFSLSFLSLTIFFSTCNSQEISTDPSYYYNLCAPSTCGNYTVSYPYSLPILCRPSILHVECPNNEYLLLSSAVQTDKMRVVGRVPSNDSVTNTFLVASENLFGCGQVSWPNYAVDPNLFSLPVTYTYGTHLNCTTKLNSSADVMPASCLGCPGNADGNVCYYKRGFVNFPGCEPFYLFIPEGFNVSAEKDLKGYLRKGFESKYTKSVECQSCEKSGGRCGSNPGGNFVCFCPSSVHRGNCSDGLIEDLKSWAGKGGGSGGSKRLIIALSASASAIALLLVTLVGVFVYRRKLKTEQHSESFNDLISDMSPTRYSYSQIKKFTNNFATKIGEGGFGSVYKGMIKESDGEVPVAIKLLKESKQNEKQFMNEVATVGRIHHNNLVRMLGYCVHGKKRALVYEFIEKGSLDRYIYVTKKEGIEDEQRDGGDFKILSPKQRHVIALETARGILYLHQGCRSRILHCDIKPHNVLLDSNLSVKVADFGLAKLIDKDHSNISVSASGGTPGYAAPEMWSKSYGPVTEKSDVYSYGMLLLELANGRKNYDSAAVHSSQVYFPEWVFRQVEEGSGSWETKGMDNFLEAREGESTESLDIEKKMCLVGLWCIQHIPSNRPSMSEVIQMLEGTIEIKTPPDPFPKDSDEASSYLFTGSTSFLNSSKASSGASLVK